MTKIAEQTKIIENNNHEELCKLSNENLHLKSRLSDLEKTFYAKKIRPLQSNDPKSWWSTIKKICNSIKNQQIFLTNSENGEPLTSSESAEEINNYLVNLTKNYVKISDDQSLTLPLVSRASVTTVGKKLNQINVKKSTGPFDPPQFHKTLFINGYYQYIFSRETFWKDLESV